MAMYREYTPDEGRGLENLERIKDNISTSYLYFKDNYERYRDFRNFVFKESVNDQQKSLLRKLVRPVVEFNILEAYISRLLGEFSKHEPSINVTASEGVPVDQNVIDFVENSLRHAIYEANKNSFSYEIYKDLLSGGFSVAKVITDYDSSMSFNQNIFIKRVFDPTLCGFDPMARDSHKGDGDYCFEIYPLTDKEFSRQFPDYDMNSVKYNLIRENGDVEGFKWSYKDIKNNKIILVVDYYEKKKKRTRIVKLSDGRVMTQKNYKKMQQEWISNNIIEQIPIVVGSPRWTILETICRYRLTEGEILDYEETDYAYLPLVFIDGNSIVLSKGKVNSTYQMTRPYVYHARGIQELKNFSGQSLANYLQNLVQHKFIIKKEAVPQDDDSLEAIKNIQKANTIIVNAFTEDNPELPIPDPIREVQNVPAPPEVMGTFQVTDPTTQVILGSFASNLGKNDNDLSGKAVIESSSVGNAAAMPYVIGYLAGLTQIGCIYVDLLPKYIKGKRQIPVRMKDDTNSYQKVNSPGNPYLKYDEKALKVNIEAGVNFQVQKNQAVEQVISLMNSSESLSGFFNSPKGLKILTKNLTIYGADNLEEAVEEWFAIQEKQKQEAMQMQQQAMIQNPQMIKAQAELQKVQQQGQQQEIENQFEVARISIDSKLADAKIIEAESRVTQSQVDSAVRLEEAETSRINHSLDAASKMAEIKSRHHDMDIKSHEQHLKSKELDHNIEMSNKKKENNEIK